MLICILTKNVITSCSVTMMLFLHLEVKPLMTLTTVLYLSCALISGHLAMIDRKSGSAGMPRPISYAVFCLKKKKKQPTLIKPQNTQNTEERAKQMLNASDELAVFIR